MLDKALLRFAPIAAAAALASPAAAASQHAMAIAGDWLAGTTSIAQSALIDDAAPCPIGQASVYTPQSIVPLRTSKTAAIIGQPSALEAMRAQQGGASLIGSVAQPRALEPAAGPAFPASGDCASPWQIAAFAAPSRMEAVYRPGTMRSTVGSVRGEYLGSRRVPIKHTLFDGEWKRVKNERPQFGRTAHRLASASASREEKLDAVNQWVNRRIAYTDDRALFGKGDHWAGPRTTLALGKGDCEDYALLKMHLLASMGVPRKDMMLTIVRDLVKRQDHAVLIVKTKQGYRMLDNASDTVLDASLSHDYRPVLSFSAERSWIHGY